MPEEKSLPSKVGMAKLGMVACCTVMFIPLIGFFVAGGTLASLGTNVAAWAPLLLCVAVHLALFKFMGKSCHTSAEEKPEVVVSSIPVVKPRQQAV